MYCCSIITYATEVLFVVVVASKVCFPWQSSHGGLLFTNDIMCRINTQSHRKKPAGHMCTISRFSCQMASSLKLPLASSYSATRQATKSTQSTSCPATTLHSCWPLQHNRPHTFLVCFISSTAHTEPGPSPLMIERSMLQPHTPDDRGIDVTAPHPWW